ncbi:MAG: acylphosphatase [Patescibacteria group bacterium]|nr:acylphosphatase [Patescibacteria group bacterium]MDD5567534.1 acylphosphatase [Patescibacteria group bacterium]
MKQRLSLKVFGEVQGINLRSMVKVQAMVLSLTGCVTNQNDGTVEIEAEGEKEVLEKFMTWLNSRPGHAQIDRMTENWSEATGEYSDFVIKD